MLSGKKILLGITGSIAAYKSLQIVRDLTDIGADVHVVLTKSARKFIPSTTLQVFSGHPVHTSLFDENNEMEHLRLAQEADLILIAPVTAHFISKMAIGLNDDLLSSILLSSAAPVVIAPAMDIGMWEHPAVQNNVSVLHKRGVQLIGPEIGSLASGKVGVGRFSDHKKIVRQLVSYLAKDPPLLAGEVVLVTAGPTQEAIDPIRFISNRSSGKMGYALADVAKEWGARVILISGPTALPVPDGVKMVSVRSAHEMEKEVYRHLPKASILIMAAAVSDYKPPVVSQNKLKKTGSNLIIALEETTDILIERTKGRKGQVIVGFAAETENLLENAKKKLRRKRLDLIVANDVTIEDAGFDVETNVVHFINAKENVTSLPKMPKRRIATYILKEVKHIKSDYS